MKKQLLLLVLTASGYFFTSCNPQNETKTTLVDFEDVTLNADSIWNGSDGSGKFVSGNSNFLNNYNSSWMSWDGFSCSAKKDTVTPGYVNQYSSIVGLGAFGSNQYAVAYNSASFTCKANQYGNFNIKSLMVTNSTYAYLDMLNGSAYSKKFSTNDWYKVTFSGYLNKVATGTVDYYLADFRNGKSFMAKTWNKVDLSSLGKVDSVAISFGSSDIGQFGINTPTYVCIDNIEFTQPINQ